MLTTLGVSNVSFGLARHAREVVNSVFLYHAVQAGLDLAIVNPKDVTPYPAHPGETERTLAEELIFDRRPDALARLIAHFGEKGAEKAAAPAEDLLAGKSSRGAASTCRSSTAGRRGCEALIDDALTRRSAVAVLNEVLLPAMKDVGDKFGAGELILPFVLQSAEVMKKAVGHLEQFLEKNGRLDQGDGGAGHRLRRRPRHRQEPGQDHPLQQRLHGARPRQAGAGGHHHREGGRGRRRRHRPLGAAGLHLQADALLRGGAAPAQPRSSRSSSAAPPSTAASATRPTSCRTARPTPAASSTPRTPSRGWSWCSSWSIRPGATPSSTPCWRRPSRGATPRRPSRRPGRRPGPAPRWRRPPRVPTPPFWGARTVLSGADPALRPLAAARPQRALQAAVGRARQGGRVRADDPRGVRAQARGAQGRGPGPGLAPARAWSTATGPATPRARSW